jgi:hypothetical protein
MLCGSHFISLPSSVPDYNLLVCGAMQFGRWVPTCKQAMKMGVARSTELLKSIPYYVVSHPKI